MDVPREFQESWINRKSFSSTKLINGPLISIDSRVYPVLILDNFLKGEELENHQAAVKNLFDARSVHAGKILRRQSDLFRFAQTPDLRDAFPLLVNRLMTDVRLMIENLSGKLINPDRVDLAAQCYGPGDYLLGHDDRLDSRSFAFVLYLTSQDTVTSSENDCQKGFEEIKSGKYIESTISETFHGGELEFVKTDWRGSPVHSCSMVLEQKISPFANRLVIFEVSRSSFHQVLPVYKGRRISLAGWFHSPTTIPRYSVRNYELPNYLDNNAYIFRDSNQVITVKNCFKLEWISAVRKIFDDGRFIPVKTVSNTFEYCVHEDPWVGVDLNALAFQRFISDLFFSNEINSAKILTTFLKTTAKTGDGGGDGIVIDRSKLNPDEDAFLDWPSPHVLKRISSIKGSIFSDEPICSPKLFENFSKVGKGTTTVANVIILVDENTMFIGQNDDVCDLYLMLEINEPIRVIEMSFFGGASSI